MRIGPRWEEANRLSLGASCLGRVPASGVVAGEERSAARSSQAGWGRAVRVTPELLGLPPWTEAARWGHRGRAKPRCCHSAVRSGGSIKL